jgi:hypothetical protein
MDALWFKLPRKPDNPEGAMGSVGRGHIAILLDRFDHWQVGYVILKGTFPELRHEGIESLQRSFTELIPKFADASSTWRIGSRSPCFRSSRAVVRGGTGRGCSLSGTPLT